MFDQLMVYHKLIKEIHNRCDVDVDEDFFYLGGGMSNKPRYNYPRFDEVLKILQGNGYSVVSPAHLDTPEDLDIILASEDGKDPRIAEKYNHFLARDLTICAMDHCKGGIFLERYTESPGATAESELLYTLGKDVYEYAMGPMDLPSLTLIPKSMKQRERVFYNKANRHVYS
jgi:hypothetical protein